MAKDKLERKLSYTSGTDGIWTYRKYDDHTYHLWYVGTINLEAGTAFAGGFFHKSGSALISTIPSWSQSISSMSGSVNGGTLAVYCGRDSDLYTYWWNSLSATVTGLAVRLDVYGTW